MTQKNLFKTSCMALLMVFVSSTAFAQDKKESKGVAQPLHRTKRNLRALTG